ncbi:MAG TPA: hypothetical protein VJY62_11620 [Bacteroidia bacterium]|nr:hypothetical protein [Bacteroidia bacterium]
MTPATQLCNKKFKLLFSPGKKEYFEKEFYNKYLLRDFKFSLPTVHALYLQDISRLAERCRKLRIEIIGIETSLESDYPLTVKVFEDYTGKVYNSEWIDRCIDELKKENILKDFVIYINIPSDVFDILIAISVLQK